MTKVKSLKIVILFLAIVVFSFSAKSSLADSYIVSDRVAGNILLFGGCNNDQQPVWAEASELWGVMMSNGLCNGSCGSGFYSDANNNNYWAQIGKIEGIPLGTMFCSGPIGEYVSVTHWCDSYNVAFAWGSNTYGRVYNYITVMKNCICVRTEDHPSGEVFQDTCGGWTCSGTGGPPPDPVDGVCGAIHNNNPCLTGNQAGLVEYPNAAAPDFYAWQWWCDGLYGGSANQGSGIPCTELKNASNPSCDLSGPTTVTVGDSVRYCVSASNAPSGAEIWKSPIGAADWGTAVRALSAPGCSSTSFSQEGTYYVVCNAYGPSNDPKCSGNPFNGGVHPGWLDCGPNDMLTVNVINPCTIQGRRVDANGNDCVNGTTCPSSLSVQYETSPGSWLGSGLNPYALTVSSGLQNVRSWSATEGLSPAGYSIDYSLEGAAYVPGAQVNNLNCPLKGVVNLWWRYTKNAPTLTFTANPPAIPKNKFSTLNWSATDVSYCLAGIDWVGWLLNTNGIDTATASGTDTTGPLTSKKSYSLECWNSANMSTGQIIKDVYVFTCNDSGRPSDTTPCGDGIPTSYAAEQIGPIKDYGDCSSPAPACQYACSLPGAKAMYNCKPPVDGKCGSANGGIFCQQPRGDKACSPGSVINMTNDVKNWNWKCSGEYGGGDSAPCTAARSCAFREVVPN